MQNMNHHTLLLADGDVRSWSSKDSSDSDVVLRYFGFGNLALPATFSLRSISSTEPIIKND